MAGVRKEALRHGRYQGYFVAYTGKRVFFTGTHDREDTRRMAERLEDEHRQIRLGYRPVPKSSDKSKGRPFPEVRDQYLSWGKVHGGRGGRPWAAKHTHHREVFLRWWEKRLGLQTLGDLDGVLGRVEEALREVAAEGRTGSTLQNYADGLAAFCDWCVKRGYLAEDPLKGMAGFDSTPKTTRRAMTPDEIAKLLQHGAPQRRLVYETALVSGLRVSELAALKVGDLDVERGGVRLHAEWTKNRKPGFQPLPSALVTKLAETCTDKNPTDALLSLSLRHASRAFGKDLAKAGIPKQAFGGKLDFHSLRVTFVTFVLQAGATVKEAQDLARHSTPELTMNVYGRSRQDRLAEVAESVGEMAFPSVESALGVQRQAVGAEAAGVSPCSYNELEPETGGGSMTFKSCLPDHPPGLTPCRLSH